MAANTGVVQAARRNAAKVNSFASLAACREYACASVSKSRRTFGPPSTKQNRRTKSNSDFTTYFSDEIMTKSTCTWSKAREAGHVHRSRGQSALRGDLLSVKISKMCFDQGTSAKHTACLITKDHPRLSTPRSYSSKVTQRLLVYFLVDPRPMSRKRLQRAKPTS